MTIIAALVYWIIVALWLAIFGTICVFYIRNPKAFGTTRLLLAVLGIDTLRNIFENVYFGLYFGGKYGLFSPGFDTVLGRPDFLIVPKFFNILSGCIVLGLLLLRWLPLAIRERVGSDKHANELETMAAVDWLTGVYNRRHFEKLARAEFARSQRYLRPLSFLMLDIDHFKEINDRFGHAAGDRVLKAIANACCSAKRDSDVVARVGGEEFALMLPETTAEAAMKLAERLRQQIGASYVTIGKEQVNVTISVGVAGAAAATSGIESLLGRADHALYQAKRSGRNRVALYRTDEPSALGEAAE